jgi:TPR repeat protein
MPERAFDKEAGPDSASCRQVTNMIQRLAMHIFALVMLALALFVAPPAQASIQTIGPWSIECDPSPTCIAVGVIPPRKARTRGINAALEIEFTHPDGLDHGLTLLPVEGAARRRPIALNQAQAQAVLRELGQQRTFFIEVPVSQTELYYVPGQRFAELVAYVRHAVPEFAYDPVPVGVPEPPLVPAPAGQKATGNRPTPASGRAQPGTPPDNKAPTKTPDETVPADVLKTFVQPGSVAEPLDALDQLQNMCRAGHVRSCFTAGTHFKDGTGGAKRDLLKARGLFGQACSADILMACNDLAFLLARGDGGPVDIPAAIELFSRSCSRGEQLSCYNSAILILPDNPVRAIELYRTACERGTIEACYNLASVYADGKYVPRDTVLSKLYYRRTCDGGLVRGCGALEVQRENERLEALARNTPVGDTIVKLEQDCANRQPRACNDLAMRLFEGDGVARDWVRSAELMKRACEGSSPTACFNLGTMYSGGHGLVRDLSAAAALFLRACDGGHKLGCQTLAETYLSGDGVRVEPVKASELFERLCLGGRALSCVSLGRFHETHASGKGADEALKWFEKALVLDREEPQAKLGVNRLRPIPSPPAHGS